MNIRSENLKLAMAMICAVAGLSIVALAPTMPGIFGGMSLVAVSILLWYRIGQQEGKRQAIDWARHYHGFDFDEAKERFREWGI